MTKILKISDDIKISQDNLNIKNLITKKFHASGDSLQIKVTDYTSNSPCLLLIQGSGNSNYYLGSVSGQIIKLLSNGAYDSGISFSDDVITMPTSGYYYWELI